MIFYLAGCQRKPLRYLIDNAPELLPLNILESFVYLQQKPWLEPWINDRSIVGRFLFDSGAFTYMNGRDGSSVDWDDFARKYAAMVNKHNVEHYVELDIDVIVGLDRVVDLRHRLEDLTGKPAIPVWHKSRGKEDFLRTAEEYDYIAFGGLITDGIKPSMLEKYMPWFIRESRRRGAKIHGLGYTVFKGLEKCKFDSVDYATWANAIGMGDVHVFDGRKIVKHKPGPGRRAIDAPTRRNLGFIEWAKFQKYAEGNL